MRGSWSLQAYMSAGNQVFTVTKSGWSSWLAGAPKSNSNVFWKKRRFAASTHDYHNNHIYHGTRLTSTILKQFQQRHVIYLDHCAVALLAIVLLIKCTRNQRDVGRHVHQIWEHYHVKSNKSERDSLISA